MASSSSPAVEQPSLSRAYDLLFELYDIHDFYFSSSAADKEKLLRAGADRVLDELRPFCGGDGLTPKERAKFFFVRGRTLDVFSWYSEEAAACLTRAVKLNPAEVDAWNALGHCFWKKGDLKAARECFLDAIAKRPNAKSLQQLSMLLRQLPASGTELKANVQESVLRAKEALALGLRDGDSWYALGNAHATQFFRVTHAPEDLDKALQAFARAEANGGEMNPDLHFNRAKVLEYKMDYGAAAAGYRAALNVDPLLPAADALRDIERSVARLVDLVDRKGRLKPKRFSQLIAPLAAVPAPDGLVLVPLAALREGANPGVAVALKLVVPGGAPRDAPPPEQLVAADAVGRCVVLALYHVNRATCERLQQRDVLVVREPTLRLVGTAVGVGGAGGDDATAADAESSGTVAADIDADVAAAAAGVAAMNSAATTECGENAAAEANCLDARVTTAGGGAGTTDGNASGLCGAGSGGDMADGAIDAPVDNGAITITGGAGGSSSTGDNNGKENRPKAILAGTRCSSSGFKMPAPAADNEVDGCGSQRRPVGAGAAAAKTPLPAGVVSGAAAAPRTGAAAAPAGNGAAGTRAGGAAVAKGVGRSYLCIQVATPASILLNGEPLGGSYAPATLRLAHFDT